jgi:hypothetical protein
MPGRTVDLWRAGVAEPTPEAILCIIGAYGLKMDWRTHWRKAYEDEVIKELQLCSKKAPEIAIIK